MSGTLQIVIYVNTTVKSVGNAESLWVDIVCHGREKNSYRDHDRQASGLR